MYLIHVLNAAVMYRELLSLRGEEVWSNVNEEEDNLDPLEIIPNWKRY